MVAYYDRRRPEAMLHMSSLNSANWDEARDKAGN